MPWPIHHNAPSSEFIASLRDWAISNRVEDVRAELETAHEELTQAEEDRDDLFEELESLVKAIDENVDPDAPEMKAVEVALGWAQKALERHSDDKKKGSK